MGFIHYSKFDTDAPLESGFFSAGDVRGAGIDKLGKKEEKAILIPKNDDSLQLIKINRFEKPYLAN